METLPGQPIASRLKAFLTRSYQTPEIEWSGSRSQRNGEPNIWLQDSSALGFGSLALKVCKRIGKIRCSASDAPASCHGTGITL